MLTIARLVEANVQRTEGEFGHKLKDWSLMEWGSACAGECGEANNIAKKIVRLDMGLDQFNKPGETRDSLYEELANEIADMIHYATLWAAAAGIDLELALVSKFNKVSYRIGAKERL